MPMRRSPLRLSGGVAVAMAVAMAACAAEPAPEPPATAPPAVVPTTTPNAPSAATSLPPLTGLAYEKVTDAPFANALVARGDVLWVGTKDGRIWQVGEGGLAVLADISDRVRNEGEQGLLGMAPHPDDRDRLFVHYSATDGDTVLAEYAAGDTGPDPASERVLLRIDQPAANHNGGPVVFGPDGMLYLALGDGGGAGDRYGNGQNIESLLGGILRIDADWRDGGDPYGIPSDNPFVGRDGADELWVYGLRNPWRIVFDDGWLYIADVGQDAFEEVNVVPADAAGTNFGWPLTEGFHCYSPRSGCDTGGLTLPVLEVAHGDGGACSITGGVVYRGEAIPELFGHYLYSDYCGGWLRSFRWDGSAAVEGRDWTSDVGVPGPVVSFGTDEAGEVHVLTPDAVWRIVPVR